MTPAPPAEDAAATAAAAAQQPTPRAFKPYGSPPPFDLDAEKDSFDTWFKR